MNMIQRQLGLVPSIVRKEDKGEYIQSLVDSREYDDSAIAQDVMLRHHIANLNRRVMQYQGNDSVNDGVNNKDVGVNVGDMSERKITGRQKEILRLIRESPTITAKRMSEILSVTSRTIERDIASLKGMGILTRKGADNDGEWIIHP